MSRGSKQSRRASAPGAAPFGLSGWRPFGLQGPTAPPFGLTAIVPRDWGASNTNQRGAPLKFITQTHFPHHKLVAYDYALDLLLAAKRLADQLPAGYATFGNQLLRSAGSVVLNTGEGANGRTAGEKRNAFGIARKEAGEAACAAEAIALMGLVDRNGSIAVVQAADRVAGTLTGLIKRWSGQR